MKGTVGEIEVLTIQQYSLGVVLGFTFISISVLNILFLMCFYNLRHQAFVQNSVGIISLVVTDLVNAIILTPTLFLWFFLPPPNDYVTCLVKSLPFMVSNYTSLLSMTSFCIHRFIVIRSLTTGRIKVRSSKYGFVTLATYLSAILLVSLPYMLWANSNKMILDCRRALFSDVEAALQMFSWFFDIPLTFTNLTVLILMFKLKRYQQANIANFNENFDSEVTESRIKYNVIESVGKKGKNDQYKNSVCTKGIIEVIDNTMSDIKLFDDDTTSDVDDGVFKIQVLPHGVQTVNATDAKLSNGSTRTGIDTAPLALNFHQDGQNKGITSTDNATCRSENDISDHMALPHPRRSTKTEYCEQTRINDERCHMFRELKQFLITMGILVLVYDVTVLPLIVDINMGAQDQTFLVPHVLNSLCFLNSFCNPLIRMKQMRQENKRILSKLFDKVFCRSRIID